MTSTYGRISYLSHRPRVVDLTGTGYGHDRHRGGGDRDRELGVAMDGHRVQDPAQRVPAVPGRIEDLNGISPGLRGAPRGDRDRRRNGDSRQVDTESAAAPQVVAGQPQRSGVVPAGG